MKHKFLLGYIFSNLSVFLIPLIFSFFIKGPAVSSQVFGFTEDKPQTQTTTMTVSVMDSETKKISNQSLEEYLIGVVSAEMPASYESEALKAQAVAARSYILSKADSKNPDHPDAVVCDNPTHCKGHLSLDTAKQKWGDAWEADFYPKIKAAVYDTAGEYLTYENETVEAFFFALSNGETESAGEVWGTDLPYLKSTDSKADSSSPDFYSTAEFSLSDFNAHLKNLSSDFKAQSSVSLKNTVYTEGGRVKSIDINGCTFSGTDIRSAFLLNSADFTIQQEGDKITFYVEGKGHGVGMSQYGANQLAKEGYTYEEILKHYYSGVEIIDK